MGKVKKIVNGVVTEVDDSQMIKTIENGVVVEKPYGEYMSEKKNPVGNDLKNGAKKSDLETPSTSLDNIFDPLYEFNKRKAANTVTTGSSILGNIEITDEDVPPNIMDKAGYRKSLQQRLDAKQPAELDLQVIAGKTKKPIEAVKEYTLGRDGKGVMLEFDAMKNKKASQLNNLIEGANKELGLNDTFDAVFTSTETAKSYIDKIQQAYDNKTEQDFNSLNTRTIDGKTITYDEDSERYIDKRLPAGRRYYDAIKNRNNSVVSQFKNLIGEDILEKVENEEGLTYGQKVQKIGNLVYGKDLKQIEEAKKKRQAIDALGNINPIFKLGGIFRDEKEEQVNLNAINSVVESRLNRAIKEKIIYEQAALNNTLQEAIDKADAGSLSDEEKFAYQQKVEQLKKSIEEKKTEYKTPQQLQKKYPVLLKQAIIADINEFNAIQSGNVKGYEEGGYKGIGLIEHLQAQGYDLNDQIVQDTVSDAMQGIGVKDYSFFGEPIKAIEEVFTSSAKSLGDITGLRDDVTILSEKTAAELFPTTVGANDELQLTKSAETAQNISNTTGQVIGQGLMQFGTAGIGRMAGLSRLAASNIGFWSSGALTSYDDAYKDSFDFIDSNTGRTAYAGLIALANAASEKIFPESKLFTIPGVKSAVSELANKIGTKEFTDKLANQLLTKAKNAFIDYGEKYATNVGKETLEETATSLFESGTRFIFGDPNIDYETAIENAKKTAIQTAIGTSLVGGFGAHKDVQQEKNISPKSVIYNSAVYHDEAMDALNIGFKEGQYDGQQLNQKIQILNAAKEGLTELSRAEEVIGRDLSRPQKELFVANNTAHKLLTKQKEGVVDNALLGKIDEKLRNLQSQQNQLLDDKVQFDEFGNVVPEKVEAPAATEIVNDDLKKQAATIVDTLQGNDKVPDFEFTAMVADPISALQGIADQALGFGRDEQGIRQPLSETANESQLEAVTSKFGKEVVDKAIEMFPAESKPTVESAVIEINGKNYEGKNHADAILQAKKAGEDISQVNRKEQGKFKLSDGTIISRDVAKEKFGADRAEQLIKQDEVSKKANKEYEKENQLSRAKEIVNKLDDDSYSIEPLKEAAKNDEGKFTTYLSNIAEQANDEKSYETTVKTYGKELVNVAQEMFPKEVKPTVNQQAAAEEKTSTLNALNRADAKKVYNEVRQLDEPTDAKGLALSYLAHGGKVSEDAINEVAGTVKRASLNTGAKETKSSEVKARDYSDKNGKGIDEIVHGIWDNLPENLQNKIDIQDIKNELQDAINSHNTRLSSAQEYIKSYGVEEPTFATEEQVTAEEEKLNEWLNSDSQNEYEPEFISDNEVLNIINYDNENETEDQQPSAEKENGSDKPDSQSGGPEKGKDLGDKARDLAKKIREKGVLPDWLEADLPEGTQLKGIDINEAFAKGLETFADVYDKAKDFADAVEQGFKHIRDWYNDNGVAFDETTLKEAFAADLRPQVQETVKEVAESIRKDQVSYNDAIEGKSQTFIDELNTELFGSKKVNFDTDAFKAQVRKQKSFGLTEAEVIEGFEAAKKLTRLQKGLIAEIFAETAETDKIAAELKEAFKSLAKGEKPKSVLKRLGVSHVTELVNALKDVLTYRAVSNDQLEEMANFIVDSIDLKKADQYVNALVNNSVADVRQLLRAKLIIALQQEGNKELATQLIREMADEATVSGRQTQSLKRAYEILGAKGDPATRTEFAKRYAEAVQEKARQMTQRMGDVISDQEAEIGKLNERLHQKTQSSPLINKIKEIISTLCGLRSKK